MRDEVGDQIAALDAQIAALQKERAQLERLHGEPRVEPVQVFWRYHSLYREPYDGTLEEAFRSLEFMSDNGDCYAEAVEVGGVRHEIVDLRDRFDPLSS